MAIFTGLGSVGLPTVTLLVVCAGSGSSPVTCLVVFGGLGLVGGAPGDLIGIMGNVFDFLSPGVDISGGTSGTFEEPVTVCSLEEAILLGAAGANLAGFVVGGFGACLVGSGPVFTGVDESPCWEETEYPFLAFGFRGAGVTVLAGVAEGSC